jgi:serine/threonine protein kinase/tetratricopeptide (TPR) repeat protein
MQEAIRPSSAEQPFDAGARFDVRRRLGTGGMGVVYEAYDRELRELVALKTLRNAAGGWLARFKREFRALHDLAHPNLVALGEFFDGESEPFFSMELVRGLDFLSYVRQLVPRESSREPVEPLEPTEPALAPEPCAASSARVRPATPHAPTGPAIFPIAYDERRLRESLRQLAEGISALHEAGMVHRDIKPSNVLVTPEGRVVLLDFGVVKDAGAASASVTEAPIGTLAYMAPEQALSERLTPAADCYALGVMLFEALTGALPVTGRTVYDLAIKKRQQAAASPRALVASVPEDLDVLCSALLERDPGARPRPRDILELLGGSSPHDRARDSVRSGGRSSGLPFVGRADALATLRAAYEGVRDRPVIHLVEGVSGVGKTQLVERFLADLSATERDALVLSARCYEREVVSFKALDGITEGLARFLARLPAIDVTALLPRRPALLARLFPAFKQVAAIAAAPPVPDVPDPQDQRQRMFGALRELFVRVAMRRRMVWFIDDLQWTDADSLVLLADMLAHDDAPPVLIVATTRPADDAARRELVERVRALAPTEQLRLTELSPGEARELVERLLPGGDPSTLDVVAAESGGHPMLLHELARHADQSRDSAAASVTLEEMLGARIGRLDAAARGLLETLAVAGGPLTQDVAALATELSSADMMKAAALLRAAHLARTDGVRRSDRIVPYHDRVREHVDAHLDPERRRSIHERLAIALEQTGAAAHDPRALVRHARAAGRSALAAASALVAARHAVAGLAFDQAAEFFATAIELGSYDGAALRELQIELATALMHAGRGPEAAATFMAAAEGAEPAVRLDCQRHAAEQWLITGHLERGMEALRSSLADIDEPPAATPLRALLRVLWNRLRLRVRGTQWVTRLESQVPAETLRRLDVLGAVAHGLAMIDNIRGADFNGRFLLLALRIGEPRRLLGALASEVVFLAREGGRSAARARRLFRQMAPLAEICPDRAYARTWLLLADGAASFFEGRFAPAVDSLAKAEEIFAEGPGGLTYEKNNTRVFRVHALRLLGALRQQASLIGELVRSGRLRGDRYVESTLRLLEVQSLVARDNVAEARRNIEGAGWTPPANGYHLQHWYELRARAELALYEGDAEAASVRLAADFAALGRSMLLRVKVVRADAVSLGARLQLAAAARGRAPERARAEILRRARSLEREGAGYATVYALLLRAGLVALEPHRKDEDAVDHLRRAVEHAAANDMALHLAAARDRLGALLGGDEGASLRAAAAAYAAQEGIADPDRMFEIVAPGCARRTGGR